MPKADNSNTVAMPIKKQEAEPIEIVQQIPLEQLHPFKNHPFKVLDDDAMQQSVESIRQYGVMAPLIARPREDGGYEIISGHRRKYAAELAGLKTLPVIVRPMDDNAAVILMVDSNLQREGLLPSERAFAYKMKMEAIKHQGKRTDLTSGQVGQKSESSLSSKLIAQQTGDSSRNVHRYIRLTYLIPALLEMVDQKKIAFNPAVELSYLTEAEQKDFMEAMGDCQNAPSLSQAQRIKKLSREGQCTYEAMFAIMGEAKKDELDKLTISNDVLRQYFPRSYTPRQMQDTIIKLLEQWQRKRQREQSR
jgi:ParB family chromosome partitioning protein